MSRQISIRLVSRSAGVFAAVAAFSTLIALPASAQTVVYDGTFFLHGFNDNSARWTTKDSPNRIAQQVNVGQYRATPDLSSSQPVAYQTKQLKDFVFPHYAGSSYAYEKTVLTGLSMGGIVARDVLLNPDATISSPARVGGIVTIASPHRGAPIAENALKIDFYFPSMSMVEGFFEVFNARLLGPASVISASASAILSSFAHEIVMNSLKKLITDRFGLNNAAAKDLRPDSPTIARLRDATDNVPHANVIGIIPKRNAVYRIASGVNYGDGETLIRRKNQLKSVTKACTQLFYNAIVKTGLGKKCHAVDKFIGSVDDRWNDWTHGPDKSTPFDGFLPKDYTPYPGLPDGDRRYVQVPGVNHMTIQFQTDGVNGIAQAMLAMGMPRPASEPVPTALSVSISGPSSYNSPGVTVTFDAVVAGGSGGYVYQWRSDASGAWADLGTGSSQTVTTPAGGTSFAVDLTVTTSTGEVQRTTHYVTYDSGSCGTDVICNDS